jgi:hypothetical protein
MLTIFGLGVEAIRIKEFLSRDYLNPGEECSQPQQNLYSSISTCLRSDGDDVPAADRPAAPALAERDASSINKSYAAVAASSGIPKSTLWHRAHGWRSQEVKACEPAVSHATRGKGAVGISTPSV